MTPTSQDSLQIKFTTASNENSNIVHRAKLMWLLAYTLTRNPQLKELRRREKQRFKPIDSVFTQELVSPVAAVGNSIFDVVNEEKNKFKMDFP